MISAGQSAGPYYQIDGAPSGSPSTTAATSNAASTVAAASSAASGSYSRSTSHTSSFPPIAPAPAPMPMAPQHMMHPAPLLPYPHHQPPHMHMPNAPGAQGQIICSGCRTLLVYPNNASNVRCALCTTVTPVPPAGTEMAQLVCGGCRTLLMYVRGASSVQCSCCHTVNLAMDTNQIAHINCGGCGMTLMYSYGAPSVKCAVCQFISNVSGGPNRMPLPMQRPPYTVSQSHSQTQPTQMPNGRSQTVVVENPMTLDENGKLVNSVAVGVSADTKN